MDREEAESLGWSMSITEHQHNLIRNGLALIASNSRRGNEDVTEIESLQELIFALVDIIDEEEEE